MEIVAFAKEVAQNVAEHAASYRVGQSALRYLDKALWVVEKCARWAVPPPLDQDERPQPELVRPLPWLLFLPLLVALRITRESISLVNLVLGKPPLRSADVVMYIQSKRRYLRTLKYQGSRMIRARAAPREPWHSGLRALFEFTMCFRRSHYDNNNTTRVSNNDEVLVVKRSKRTREPASPVASTSETTMERLIEKMMVDLDADSDDDSSFTLTNATSIRSDQSDSESDHDSTEIHNSTVISGKSNEPTLDEKKIEDSVSPIKGRGGSTPIGDDASLPQKSDVASSLPEGDVNSSPQKSNIAIPNSDMASSTPKKIESKSSEEKVAPKDKSVLSTPVEENFNDNKNVILNHEDAALQQITPKTETPIEESQNFLQSERCPPQKVQQSSKNTKIANGRTKSTPGKRKGVQAARQNSDVPDVKVTPATLF